MQRQKADFGLHYWRFQSVTDLHHCSGTFGDSTSWQRVNDTITYLPPGQEVVEAEEGVMTHCLLKGTLQKT